MPPATGQELEPAKHDAYAALRDPNYRRYVLGFICAAIGLQALATAVGWEVYEQTRSTVLLGLTGLARVLPVLLLALPAGHTADVFERRVIIAISQVGFAVSAAFLAIVSFSEGSIWLIYLLLLLSGCCRAFNGPARGSFLPTIVPREVFENAVAWTSTAFQLSAMVGPILAGGLIYLVGKAWPAYLLCAVCNLIFAITVIGIKPLVKPTSTGKYTFESMIAGMSHLWREKTIFGAITLDLLAVLFGGATALLPVFAKDILTNRPVDAAVEPGLLHEVMNNDAIVLGALRASTYIGAFLMGIFLAHRAPFRRSGRTLLWSVAGFGVAMIVFGVSKNLWLSLAALFLAGAMDQVSVVVRHVLIQVRTPDHLRGRVGAVNSVFIECSNELGALESGLLARAIGPVLTVVAGGIGTIFVAGGIGAAFPELRRLGPLREAEVPTVETVPDEATASAPARS
jgi:MFS family permease